MHEKCRSAVEGHQVEGHQNVFANHSMTAATPSLEGTLKPWSLSAGTAPAARHSVQDNHGTHHLKSTRDQP